MDPQLYLEFDTDLQVAACEEYLGREYCRRWLARSEGTEWQGHGQYPDGTPKEPWQEQPRAYEWIVTLGNPYYPHPPDYSPNQPLKPTDFTYRAATVKHKPGEGGVVVLTDDILSFATQAQQLSDGSTYGPIDWQTEGKTLAQLSPEGELAVNPPPDPNDPF